MLEMVLFLRPVEKDAESRELLETFCVPAWSPLAHLGEHIVDECCSLAIHAFICGFISIIFALDDPNDFSIGLLLDDKPIRAGSEVRLHVRR